jgi:hypothetical protein
LTELAEVRNSYQVFYVSTEIPLNLLATIDFIHSLSSQTAGTGPVPCPWICMWLFCRSSADAQSAHFLLQSMGITWSKWPLPSLFWEQQIIVVFHNLINFDNDVQPLTASDVSNMAHRKDIRKWLLKTQVALPP